HDFLGDVDNTLSQDVVYTDNESLGDTWYVVDIGTNVKVGKAWSLYLDAETSLNAQVKTKYNLNAGVRYAF
ncbi:MAG: autotransporter outer membrane beta-barrel domain-containing protein, partial [Sutterella sp.]